MSRYIDAEYCEGFFDRWESRVKNAEPVTIDGVQNTRTLLREAPSIDIVFCKECRKSHIDGKTTHYLWCTEWGRSTDTFGYCERGEREDE